jgi:membrane protein DedA with SNARE-associated domain
LENIIEAITGFLQQNNNPLGLLILGASALIEYVFPPFPGDTVTLVGSFLVVQHDWNLPLVFGVVLAGSVVGALLDYQIGVWMGDRYRSGRFIKKPKQRAAMERAIESVRRHGPKYIMINRFLPAIRAAVFLAAGMAGLKRWVVLVCALVSAAAWNAMILALGYALGANWDRIREIFRQYGLVAWCLLGVVIAALVIRYLLKRRRSAGSPEGPADS